MEQLEKSLFLAHHKPLSDLLFSLFGADFISLALGRLDGVLNGTHEIRAAAQAKHKQEPL